MLKDAHGKTVLDIGCADGLVGYEFIKAGCKYIHGIELDRKEYNFAKKLWSKAGASFKIVNADFANEPLECWYDIVLYLGVHHHFVVQYGLVQALKKVKDLAERSCGWFVFRTAHDVTLLNNVIINSDFRLVIERKGFDKVGPLYAYKRWPGESDDRP